MQNSRLFEIVYILLDQKRVSAKYLAERFEVSVRTIYRDVDALSLAGIPIYASVGKGGGISLMEHFVLNKSVLSEDEQREILMGLQSLKALKYSDAELVFDKMSRLFQRDEVQWIEVNFSNWGNNGLERHKFELIKKAILSKKTLSATYYSAIGETTRRVFEPFQMLFKGQSWYAYGYCRLREDFRVFKLSRIKDLTMNEESFFRAFVPLDREQSIASTQEEIDLVLRFKPELAFRVLDEFDPQSIVRREDGFFDVTMRVPSSDWIYGFLLSFGEGVEIMSPIGLRHGILDYIEKTKAVYLG